MIFPEYSQKMTLADLSKSKSLISIDIPIILKTDEGERKKEASSVLLQLFKSCVCVENSTTLDFQIV